MGIQYRNAETGAIYALDDETGRGQPPSSSSTALWPVKGRGSVSNRSGRFETYDRQAFHDGWLAEFEKKALRTTITEEQSKSIITKNTSPDVPFEASINPYRGCEHGCVYCFARPTHAYMGLSAGLDFEQKLFAKADASDLLEKELAKPGYIPKPIALGTNTDPYQPIEQDRRITRSLLKVLLKHRHPFTIVTKSRLVVRDLDILAPAAELGLVKVMLSLTSLDRNLARVMEPRAATPQRRLDALNLLNAAGVPTGVLYAPVIPALNDHEMEAVLAAAAHAGAMEANYILLRLPLEIKDLFAEWLETHFPDRKKRVLSRLSAMRYGKLNDPRFGHRMKGVGIEADLLRQRFERLARRLRLNVNDEPLNQKAFQAPVLKGSQLGFAF